MRNIKKVVFIKNAVETLGFFSEQIADTFKENGLEIFFVDYNDLFGTVTRLSKFVNKQQCALITFNFIGLSGEDVFVDETGRYFWEKNEMFCINILVDHPLYYHSKLAAYASGESHICKDMVVFCVDREHVWYIKRFYPEISVDFLPLAGNCAKDSHVKDVLPVVTESSDSCCRMEKERGQNRTYDLIFAANYVPLASLEQKLSSLDAEYAAFYYEIIEDLLADSAQSLERVLEYHIRQAFGEVSDRELCAAMGGMVLVDLYIRSWFREKILNELAKADLRVHIFGAGWEHLKCKKEKNLILNGRMVSSGECLEAIAKARISLNIMPWFKDGAHDRIFTSMLQKTAVLTDESRYLRELFADGESLVYFSLKNISDLPKQVYQLLENEESTEQIAHKGYLLASNLHTWKNRANVLLERILK